MRLWNSLMDEVRLNLGRQGEENRRLLEKWVMKTFGGGMRVRSWLTKTPLQRK